MPLDDQVIIEQGKGTLAGLAGITVDEAFTRIQRYVRHHDSRLLDVCHQFADGTLNLTTFQENSLKRPRSK